MQWEPTTVSSPRLHRFRHHRKTTAHAGETAVLGKAAQFNRTHERTRDLENRARNFRIGNVRLVRGVEEQKRVMFARVIHPARQLRTRCDGTSWIVWKTKIDEIDVLLRWLRHEVVLRGAGQIMNSVVGAVLSRRAGMTRHDVCVHVHRIDWIRDRNLVLVAENIEDVTAIVFGSVRNEDFVISNVDIAVAVVALRDLGSEKLVALFGTIAAKTFAMLELINGALHRFNRCGRKRLSHITNSAADQSLRPFRMCFAELADASGHLWKQIAGLKFKIIFVEIRHRYSGIRHGERRS